MNKLNVLPQNPEPDNEKESVGKGRFPSWLHRKLPKGSQLWNTGKLIAENRLATVCEEAKCPNLLECWSKRTATFLVMGKECTRNCGFCDIDFSKNPKALEEDEPKRVADSVQKLQLKHVVITMVARDDLADGGACHLSSIIKEIRANNEEITIEVLTSDFNGNKEALKTVLEVKPEIFNHNLETVKELTSRVRHKATYNRSLELLHFVKEMYPSIVVKTGLMVGLGEKEEEVYQTLRDLKEISIDVVTIGQYLQANHKKLLVKEFIHPNVFKRYEEFGYSIGIPYMYCGPFVRSSYNAQLVIKNANNKICQIDSV
ncbi:Lipoyl synthase [Candidatus Rubidus massiliensis]|nr:Lipoyl synthase [Candidatus Rubidus massiliensis]